MAYSHRTIKNDSVTVLMRFLFLLVLMLPNVATSAEINVAVASNFTHVFKKIAALFEADSGHKVNLSIASSGKHYAQIRYGAPFHLFLSADQEKPVALEQSGLVVTGSRFTYAIGKLVLVAAKRAPEEPSQSILMSGSFERIAIANPKLAPYGKAAEETLRTLDLWGANQTKLVMGENIAQTYQFLNTGNVDLAFISVSQLLENSLIDVQEVWEIPASMYTPIRQDAVLLKSAEDLPAAMEFYKFLKNEKVVRMIESFGYRVPKSQNIGSELE